MAPLRGFTRKAQAILGTGVLIAGLGLAGWGFLRPPRPVRVMILPPEASTGDPALDAGLPVLLADHLEVLAGATVIRATTLPRPADLRRLPADLRLLRFQGRRDPSGLAFAWAWTTPAALAQAPPGPLTETAVGPPAEALERWVARWPLPVRYPLQASLVTESPDRFWDLLDALAIQDDASAATALGRTQRLAEAEPGCATAWTALGDQLYRSLWVRPEEAGVDFNARTSQAFQRALALVPGHPRATYLWSLFLTDLGDQPRALRRLIRARKLRPCVPDLSRGLAYAGRTAGLLDGARRALAWHQHLLDGLPDGSPWSLETTYLYLGDTAAFQREIGRVQAVRQDASVRFYQGYVALLQGHPDLARMAMKAGAEVPGASPFRDLCRAYLAQLERRTREGLSDLEALDEVRGRLRIPDGEWTFKEAEAYALLGDANRAMDSATRAFVQGFSCAHWFDASPFLARARTHPRWPTLARNVRERQAILERTFPASAFEP
ncbi:MAG TPA: hypothetical protein VF768_02330 [Holophagaceae bacterium]